MSEEKEKRKRRSFWEPRSQPVIDWLDNQTDVSRSIQLAIIDTIAKYGTGDAVEGLINAQSGVTPQAVTRQASAPVEQQAQAQPVQPTHAPPQQTPQAQAQPPVTAPPVEPRETVPDVTTEPTKAPYDPLAVMFGDVDAIKR